MTGQGPGQGRAGHEHEPDYVDRDVSEERGVEREGSYEDGDVAPGAPTAEREGDFTDKDVTEADTDTPPGSYVRRE